MKITWAVLIILLAVFAMPAVADEVDRWIQNLKDPSPFVREAAAEALGKLNYTSAVSNSTPPTESSEDKLKFVYISKPTAEDWVGQGYLLSVLGEYEEAIQAFDNATAINPQDADAWNGKGLTLKAQGKYDEAVQAYDKAIEINQKDEIAWKYKGSALVAQGKYNDAIQAFDKAIEIDPQDADPWYGKGLALDTQRKYDKAIQAYDKAIEIDPQYAAPWNGKGESLRSQGKYDEAFQAYNEAIKINPQYSSTLYGRDLILQKLGRTSDSNKTEDKGSWVLLQLQGAVVQLNIDPKNILMKQFNASSVAQFGAGYVITVNGTVQDEVQKDLLDDLGYSGSRIIQRNSTTLTTIYTSPESVIATFLGKRLDTDVQVINSAPVQYEIRTNITREALNTLLAPVGGSIASVNNSFVEGLMPDTANLTKSILNDKLERLRISGASFWAIDNKFVLVHMPGIDPVTAQDIVSKPGIFEIRIQTQGNESEHVLYADAVESVDLPRSDQNGMWSVPFTLSSDGAATLQKFAIDTGATKNPNAHELSMYLDESLLFIAPLSPKLAASIQKAPLKYFRAEVGTGDAGSLNAKVLYINLQGSALPNNVRVIFSWYG